MTRTKRDFLTPWRKLPKSLPSFAVIVGHDEFMADGFNVNTITFLGRTNFRNRGKVFGIRQMDRRAHMYIIGKTGTGKSILLEVMIRQDVAAGRGLVVFDRHGDLVERSLTAIPQERKRELIYFNVPEASRPLGFNPLENVPPEKRALAASGTLDMFKKIWIDSWGPRKEHILRKALLAPLDRPLATLSLRRLLKASKLGSPKEGMPLLSTTCCQPRNGAFA